MVVGGPIRDLGHYFRVKLQGSFIFRKLFWCARRVVLAVAFFISKGHLLGDGVDEALICYCCAGGRGAEEERSHRAHAALWRYNHCICVGAISSGLHARVLSYLAHTNRERCVCLPASRSAHIFHLASC